MSPKATGFVQTVNPKKRRGVPLNSDGGHSLRTSQTRRRRKTWKRRRRRKGEEITIVTG
jgi:hypothetical protein